MIIGELHTDIHQHSGTDINQHRSDHIKNNKYKQMKPPLRRKIILEESSQKGMNKID